LKGLVVSIEMELEEDGQVRVRIDRGGERAISDVMDPMDLIRKVADTAMMDLDDIEDKWDGDEEVTEEVVEPGIDESAPPEEPSA
jgi:hypothetical protein